MAEVPRSQTGVCVAELAGKRDILEIQRPYIDFRSGKQRQRNIEGLKSADRHVGVEQLLHYFG